MIKREVRIQSSTGESMRIQAINHLKRGEMLVDREGTLVFGEGVYWDWYAFLRRLEGCEDLFFALRNKIQNGEQLKEEETLLINQRFLLHG